MSYTITNNIMYVRDDTGEFVPVSMIASGADKTISKIQEVANNAKVTVENKTNEQIQRIPEITALSVQIADIKGYLSLTEDYILGLQVDYKNKTYTRIAGAKGLNAGDDFDKFSMYGGRKRCTVADDGTITSFCGDGNYIEDGSIGQVMVYQPKFYYMITPIDLDPIEDGKGYHLRKANYYVCDRPETGFKLHPAFYDKDGNEIDYVLIGAYEGSIYDNSASSYLLLDEQVMTVSEDKFCSIAGAKPASGLTQNLTRPNIETMAQNRGVNWHLENSKIASMEQLLCMIEMGSMNTQSTIGQGVVNFSDNRSYNCSSLTGSTSSLGNKTGMATETINEKGGETTTETVNGKVSISYRGVENDWGNISKFTIDPNIYGDGTLKGGEPYYCTNFNFAESKNSDNYKGAGFTITNTGGFISAMGYSSDCDWLFMASETLGNSSLPVGDFTYAVTDSNRYRVSLLGGTWQDGAPAGGFYWFFANAVGYRHRYAGGRLIYVPNSGK